MILRRAGEPQSREASVTGLLTPPARRLFNQLIGGMDDGRQGSMQHLQVCKFWNCNVRIERGEIGMDWWDGKCQRHSPSFMPLVTTRHDDIQIFPKTTGKDWCGEHERRDDIKPESDAK